MSAAEGTCPGTCFFLFPLKIFRNPEARKRKQKMTAIPKTGNQSEWNGIMKLTESGRARLPVVPIDGAIEGTGFSPLGISLKIK